MYTGAFFTQSVWCSGWMENGGLTPATPAGTRRIHFSDTVKKAYTMNGSANCQHPTSNTNQRWEPSSLLANRLGVPLSLFKAHLAPVRWQRHVHSVNMSVKGADTERWERRGQPKIDSACIYLCVYFYHNIRWGRVFGWRWQGSKVITR